MGLLRWESAADIAVVISPAERRLTGLSAAAAVCAEQHRDDRHAGMIVRRVSSVATNLMAVAARTGPSRRSFSENRSGATDAADRPAGDRGQSRTAGAPRSDGYASQVRWSVTAWPSPGATRQIKETSGLLERASRSGSPFAVADRMPAHERAVGRADVRVRRHEGKWTTSTAVPAHRRHFGDRRERRHEPAARTDPSSPIYGMPPIPQMSTSPDSVIVNSSARCRRATPIENPLFFRAGTSMLFDAKVSQRGSSRN